MILTNIIQVDMSTDKRALTVSDFYQYDSGLKLRLINVPDHDDYSLEVEMCSAGEPAIQYTFTYCGDDIEIPDALSQSGQDVKVYIYAKGADCGNTIKTINIVFSRRPSR